MRRWHLFTGDFYYPYGGMGDHKGVFASEEDLRRELWSNYRDADWHQIVYVESDGTLVVKESSL